MYSLPKDDKHPYDTTPMLTTYPYVEPKSGCSAVTFEKVQQIETIFFFFTVEEVVVSFASFIRFHENYFILYSFLTIMSEVN